jgi:hypothetical protein
VELVGEAVVFKCSFGSAAIRPDTRRPPNAKP